MHVVYVTLRGVPGIRDHIVFLSTYTARLISTHLARVLRVANVDYSVASLFKRMCRDTG